MEDWKMPLFKIYWDQDDINSVDRVIRSGIKWAEGPSINEFELKIAEYTGVKYSLVFNSGTSVLHALLLAYGIKEGDEVIVPSFTFIATANAVLFVNAKPVFADIEEETFGLDPEDVKRKITSRTKAIIPVHYGGCPCKIEELRKIARQHNLILIEDAAEAFGAKVKEKKVGTFGDSGMLSFCQNKIITTGEGGAAVTNSRQIYEKLKLIRSHGRLEKENYFSSTKPQGYIALGYNFRMPSFVAALGIAQLKKAGRVISMRRNNSEYLTEKLSSEVSYIATPNSPKGYFHVYQLYTIRIKKNRNELMKYLASKGIMTKIYFPPAHRSYFYKKMFHNKNHKLFITEKVSKEVLTLPMYPGLTKNKMDYVAGQIKIFLRG